MRYALSMNFMPSKITKGLPRRKFTVAEIERMCRKGLIPETERFELIGGEIIPMSPKGSWHENVKRQLNRHFVKALPDHLQLIPETTFRLDRYTFIEPDFLIYPTEVTIPDISGANVLLAIEVADSSLNYDLKRKPLLYAHFGIRELWVIDAKQRTTTVHLKPVNGAYQLIETHGPEARLTPSFAPELGACLADLP
jgi:Uma2 family endonuclease